MDFVASRLVDSAWFVELSDVRSPEGWIEAVSQSLELDMRAEWIAWIASPNPSRVVGACC